MNPIPAATEPAAHAFTTSDGVRLEYHESGAGPPIVFIPGFLMPARVWSAQLQHFAPTHRALALSPRSQGRSGQPSTGHYSERRARDILEWLDHLQVVQADAVGWSMGGNELLTLIDGHGCGRLRSLTLVDVFLGRDITHESMTRTGRWVIGVQADRSAFTRKLVHDCCQRPQPPGFIDGLIADAMRIADNSAYCLLTDTLLRDFRPILDKITVPLLYCVTPLRLQADGAAMRSRTPQAAIEVFDGCGHGLFLDDPARFNQVLRDFLSQL